MSNTVSHVHVRAHVYTVHTKSLYVHVCGYVVKCCVSNAHSP